MAKSIPMVRMIPNSILGMALRKRLARIVGNRVVFSDMRNNGKLIKLIEALRIDPKHAYTYSILSGHDCPYASQCLSFVRATPEGPRVTDGPDMLFRCFSASDEARYPQVLAQRGHNSAVVRGVKTALEIADIIDASLPIGALLVRIHIGGDYYSQAYFDAWLLVAQRRPECRFYSYTKATPFWVARLNEIPCNFILTASRGGRKDSLIERHGLRSALVVSSDDEAQALGLHVDRDDSLAALPGPDFAPVIHGAQPAGSALGKAARAEALAHTKPKRGRKAVKTA